MNIFFAMVKGDMMMRDANLSFAVNSKLGWIISSTTFVYTCHKPTFSINKIQLSTNELVEIFDC